MKNQKNVSASDVQPQAQYLEAIDVVKPFIEEYRRKQAVKNAWKSVFKAFFSLIALIVSAIVKFVTGIGRVLGAIFTILMGACWLIDAAFSNGPSTLKMPFMIFFGFTIACTVIGGIAEGVTMQITKSTK